MKPKIPAILRYATEDDQNFIYSSWLKSYRNTEGPNRMSNETYYNNYKKLVKDLINKHSVLLVVNPEDTTQVYGYICYSMYQNIPVVHYIYVKYTYRKLELAKYLVSSIIPKIKQKPILVTFANRVFDKLKDSYLLIYNPFIS